jgi:orotidine-5'-phosphate decarboxylase
VGIDPDLSWLPHHLSRSPSGVVQFCSSIAEATAEFAACFKINFAFFEVLGPDGWRALAEVRAALPPGIPVIADAKRGDIGNTDRAYARSILEVLAFDAVTVSPYLGRDSVEPFASYAGKGVFLLCKTSNPGAADLQDLGIGDEPLYLHVARRALSWDFPGEIGLVVGATQPDALSRVRALSDDVVLLMPGVGAQGATARDAVARGANARGENGLCAVSRQILQASSGRDFASAAARTASTLAHETWSADAAG